MKQGQEVRVTGHPERYEWMAELVGKTGEVRQESKIAICLSVANIQVWLGKGYVQSLEEKAA